MDYLSKPEQIFIMKLKGYLGRSDGQVSGPLAGLIVGVVVLFVGLFMISTVAEVIPNTDSNVLTSVSNSTALSAGMSANDTYELTIGATILEPTLAILEVGIINNTDGELGAVNINVSLNRIAISNIAMPVKSSITNITSITLIGATGNNVSFGNETFSGGNTTSILNATIYYYGSTARTPMGVIVDSTVTTTGSIFAVLGLVIIVVALSMAIQSLRRTL